MVDGLVPKLVPCSLYLTPGHSPLGVEAQRSDSGGDGVADGRHCVFFTSPSIAGSEQNGSVEQS